MAAPKGVRGDYSHGIGVGSEVGALPGDGPRRQAKSCGSAKSGGPELADRTTPLGRTAVPRPGGRRAFFGPRCADPGQRRVQFSQATAKIMIFATMQSGNSPGSLQGDEEGLASSPVHHPAGAAVLTRTPILH